MATQKTESRIVNLPTSLNELWREFEAAHQDAPDDPMVQLLRSQDHLTRRIETLKTKIQELELRLSGSSQPDALSTLNQTA